MYVLCRLLTATYISKQRGLVNNAFDSALEALLSTYRCIFISYRFRVQFSLCSSNFFSNVPEMWPTKPHIYQQRSIRGNNSQSTRRFNKIMTAQMWNTWPIGRNENVRQDTSPEKNKKKHAHCALSIVNRHPYKPCQFLTACSTLALFSALDRILNQLI